MEVEEEEPRTGAEDRRVVLLRMLLRFLPALLIVGGVCYDVFTPRDFTAVPFFTAAPLIAAPFESLAGTVATGLVSVAATALVHARFGMRMDANAVTEIVTVATVTLLAAFLNQVLRRGDERLASARVISEAAQRAVLPRPPERLGGFRIAARYEAAQADASIGGDLYAVQDSPHGIRLIVGDVRGKGIGAVGVVAVIIGAFREAAEQERTLEAVAERLERALTREAGRRDQADLIEGFTTAVLAELPHGDGVLRLLSRGHPPPLLLSTDGTVSALHTRESALPLGMSELGSWPGRTEEMAFPSGATLLLYTDGLSEARDRTDRFYDPEARLAGRTFAAPGALLAVLAEDVRRHTGGATTDDMALLAVRHP